MRREKGKKKQQQRNSEEGKNAEEECLDNDRKRQYWAIITTFQSCIVRLFTIDRL